MRNVAHPLHFDSRGRTAACTEREHLRQLIEQVLFTTPGERVNRPTFGSGLLRLVFEPAGEALASTAQLTVQGALQQWLGDLIEVREVVVEVRDATVRVAVSYVERITQESRVERFERGSA